MENDGEAKQLILIPWPVMGHVQIVDFAKLIIHRQLVLRPNGKGLSITVLVMKLPDYIDTVSGSYLDSLGDASTSTPDLHFFHLPQTDPLPEWSSRTRGYFLHKLVLSQKPNVSHFLRCHRPNIAAVVTDMLCTSMISVADELELPAYVFFTSPASFLGTMLHCQVLHDEHNQDVPNLRHADSDVSIPSFSRPVPPNVLSHVLVDRVNWLDRFLFYARDYRKAKGIIVNTFIELESYALDSFLKNSNYGSKKVPYVYPVGPIINHTPSHNTNEHLSQLVLNWLDKQPSSSVVLVCFGSQGSLEEGQIRELAIGLEKSGAHFLWSLRRQSEKRAYFPNEYASYEKVLPEGFLDRTSGIGMVVGWVPQLKVLSHQSVGGFLSHCGWNSVLESLWCGVPMATWPLHSEQQMNAFQLVRELGLAVEITLSYDERNRGGCLVSGDRIERGIRELMEEGSKVRERVKGMKEKSRNSVEEGGSSYLSLGRVIDDIMGCQK